jgi:hypothetical protein
MVLRPGQVACWVFLSKQYTSSFPLSFVDDPTGHQLLSSARPAHHHHCCRSTSRPRQPLWGGRSPQDGPPSCGWSVLGMTGEVGEPWPGRDLGSTRGL